METNKHSRTKPLTKPTTYATLAEALAVKRDRIETILRKMKPGERERLFRQ